jgi:pyruvate kinase
MVARGDLGTEFPIEELPHLQKNILRQCITMGRPAITATQMLESMVTAPTPTRAEASDIANAVFDGSSAVMLSGETAVGHDPVLAVATMARIAERGDEEFNYDAWQNQVKKITGSMQRTVDDAVTNSMTDAARRASAGAEAAAIICVTRTGFTVRSIARFRPTAKILGYSADPRTVRQLTMSWGVTPYLIDGGTSTDVMVRQAVEFAREHGEVRVGDLVAVLSGSPDYKGQATDTLKLMRI